MAIFNSYVSLPEGMNHGLPITPFIVARSGTFGKHMFNVLKRFASVFSCLSFLADSIHQQTRYPTALQEILQPGEEFGCNSKWLKTLGSNLLISLD